MKCLRLLLPTLLALGSCSSPPAYGPHRDSLAAALQEVDQGQLQAADERLHALLGATAGDPGTFAVQRFFAAYLLTRVHEKAAYGAPFYESPASANLFGNNAETAAVGHVVATSYQAGRGRALLQSARNAPLKAGAESLLPAALETLGTQNAALHLDLSLLAVYSRLNFGDRAAQIVQAHPELLDVDRCRDTLDAARIDPPVRPWIYRALFEYLKARDEPLAYKFGVLTRTHAKDAQGSMRPSLTDGIAAWVMNESKYAFRSPAGNAFDPDLEGCVSTGTPNIEYEAELK